MTKRQKARIESLLPNGSPKKIRVYDNGGETADRFTVVFTGNYNNIGRKRGDARTNYHYAASMSANPFHPQGVYLIDSYTNVIDYPSYKRLGKKIKFEDLPDNCKKVVIEDYTDIWNLSA